MAKVSDIRVNLGLDTEPLKEALNDFKEIVNELGRLEKENKQLQNRIDELEKYVDDNEKYKEKFHLVNSWVVNKEKEVNKPKITIDSKTLGELEDFIDNANISALEGESSIELIHDPFLQRLMEIENGREIEENRKNIPKTFEWPTEGKLKEMNEWTKEQEHAENFHADDVPAGGLKEDE